MECASYSSNEPRYRANLWSGMVKIDECLVEIAPAPSLRWVVAFDDQMSTCMKVRSCVFSRRLVATTDLTALSRASVPSSSAPGDIRCQSPFHALACQKTPLRFQQRTHAPHRYSITSSASATKFGGMSMPVARAVFRLITNR